MGHFNGERIHKRDGEIIGRAIRERKLGKRWVYITSSVWKAVKKTGLISTISGGTGNKNQKEFWFEKECKEQRDIV